LWMRYLVGTVGISHFAMYGIGRSLYEKC